jgi:hypothetical protein
VQRKKGPKTALKVAVSAAFFAGASSMWPGLVLMSTAELMDSWVAYVATFSAIMVASAVVGASDAPASAAALCKRLGRPSFGAKQRPWLAAAGCARMRL